MNYTVATSAVKSEKISNVYCASAMYIILVNSSIQIEQFVAGDNLFAQINECMGHTKVIVAVCSFCDMMEKFDIIHIQLEEKFIRVMSYCGLALSQQQCTVNLPH